MASCGLEQTHQMTGAARREDAAFLVCAARRKRLRASVCAVLRGHRHVATSERHVKRCCGITERRLEEMLVRGGRGCGTEMIPCSEIISLLTVYLLYRESMPALFSSSFKIMLNSICFGFHQTKQRCRKNAGYHSPQPKNDKLEGFCCICQSEYISEYSRRRRGDTDNKGTDLTGG